MVEASSNLCNKMERVHGKYDFILGNGTNGTERRGETEARNVLIVYAVGTDV